MNMMLDFKPILKEIRKLPRYAPEKYLKYSDVEKVLNAWIVELNVKYPTVEQKKQIRNRR